MDSGKKNIFSFIALGLAILGFVLMIVAFIPMAPIKGTDVKFFGGTGTTIGWLGFFSEVLALIMAIVGLAKKDAAGPRKIALILSILLMIVTLISACIVAFLGEITKYANNEKSLIDDMDLDSSAMKSIDDLVSSIKNGYK